MLELIKEAITTLQAETATYPQGVQVWMKLMAGSFLASIVFVRSRPGSRWVLAALILNILGLIVGKILFPDASRTAIGTVVHIMFWPAMLWAVWRSVGQLSFSRASNKAIDWAYIVWLAWASLLLLVSLFFDFRTFISMWF